MKLVPDGHEVDVVELTDQETLNGVVFYWHDLITRTEYILHEGTISLCHDGVNGGGQCEGFHEFVEAAASRNAGG